MSVPSALNNLELNVSASRVRLLLDSRDYTSRLRKSHFNLIRPTCSTRYGRIAGHYRLDAVRADLLEMVGDH